MYGSVIKREYNISDTYVSAKKPWSKDFSQGRHDILQRVLVLFGCGFSLAPVDIFDTGNGGEVVAEVSDGVSAIIIIGILSLIRRYGKIKNN